MEINIVGKSLKCENVINIMIFFYSKEVVVSLIDKYLDDGKKLGGIVKGNFWKLL